MFDVQQILKQHGREESERAPFDILWQRVAERCLPRDARFTVRRSPGSPDAVMYDDYGVHCVDAGTTVFTGYVMPRGTRWQILEAPDDGLMKLRHVAAWYERKTQLLFERRNEAASGFVQQTDMSASRLLALGNQSMWVDVRRDAFGNGVGLSYRSEPLHEITITQNWQGVVDGSKRKFSLPAVEAKRRWGPLLDRAPKVAQAAADPNMERNEFEFLHVIMPNPKIEQGRGDWRGMSHVSLYIGCEDKEVIEQRGYNQSPRTYSRLKQSPGEVYGRGRGVDALPTLDAMQAIMVDIMVASELSAQPPLGAADDNLAGQLRYGPREVTFGAISPRGDKLVQSLIEAIDTMPLERIQELLHKRLDQYFYTNMLMVREDVKTHVTAFEWNERNVEKGMLLAPLAQQETEWFSPMLPREIACMDELGDFDDMPGEVAEAGGLFAVRYANPLNGMMEAAGAAGFFRTVEQMAPIWNVNQGALDAFLAEYPIDRVQTEIARINGVPATWLATDEEKQAASDAQVETQQLQQLTQTLPAIGKAAKDLADAEAVGVA